MMAEEDYRNELPQTIYTTALLQMMFSIKAEDSGQENVRNACREALASVSTALDLWGTWEDYSVIRLKWLQQIAVQRAE